MALRDSYARRVRRLMTVLSYVAKESCFALKGGTAINLFVQDFPRLSVDIDLAYKTDVRTGIFRDDTAGNIAGISSVSNDFATTSAEIVPYGQGSPVLTQL